jgi:hypothetical protein
VNSFTIYALACLLVGSQAAASAAETGRGALFSVGGSSSAPKPLSELQRDLVNLRFGMFIHLSPATYPTPYPVGRSGRYVRIVSDADRPLSLGEVEVWARTE